MSYEHIRLHTICGEVISANNLLKTHSSELLALTESMGSSFIELCDGIADYDLFQCEVTADNIYGAASDLAEFIDKGGLLRVKLQRTRKGVQVELYAKLDNAPYFIKEASETFNEDEIVHHSIISKKEIFSSDDIGEYRKGYNDCRSLLWSPDIDRWLNEGA